MGSAVVRFVEVRPWRTNVFFIFLILPFHFELINDLCEGNFICALLAAAAGHHVINQTKQTPPPPTWNYKSFCGPSDCL